MASIYYEINKNNPYIPESTNYIYYNTSYDSVNNQTTINFEPTWHKIYRNTQIDSYVTTIVSVRDNVNGAEAQTASISFTAPKVSGTNSRQFFSPTPNPNKIIIQHNSDQGKKSIVISAHTQISASIYGGTGAGSQTVETGEYVYGSVGQPLNAQIQINNEIIAIPCQTYRDSVLNISWEEASDGDHNPVLGYRLYYGFSENNYIQSIDIGNTSTYSFEIKNSFNNPRKGTNFYLGLQTLASHGDLHSSIVPIGEIQIINKPPEIPKISAENIIRITGETDTDVQIKINCVDIDNDSLSYFYVLNNVASIDPTNEKEFPKDGIIKMNPEYHHLYIRAKETETLELDDQVSGDWGYLEVKINKRPKFNFSYEVKSIHQTTARNNSLIKYADTLTNIKCALTEIEAKPQNYKWEIGTDILFDVIKESASDTAFTQKINSIEKDKGGGQIIKFKLTVNDEAGDSFQEEFSTTYYRIFKITPNLLNIFPIEKTTAKVNNKYLNNFIKAQIGIELPENDIQRTFKLQLGQKDGFGTWIYKNFTEENDVGLSGIQEYGNFESKIQREIEYRFRVELSDKFDNFTYLESSQSYWRLPLFNIPEENFSFNKKEWHPLKDYVDNELDPLVLFTTLYADDVGNIGRNSYLIEAEYENKNYILADRIEYESSKEWNIKINEVEGQAPNIYFELENLILFKKLRRATNSPQINVTYKITGYNAFGERGSTSTFSGVIITQETPIIKDMIITTNINSQASEIYKKWFNPGDEIQLNLSNVPFDYNDLFINEDGEVSEQKTISNYIIYYKYSELEEWRKPQDNWQGWQGSFVKDEEYLKTIILSNMPQLSLNGQATEIILGIQLIDDKKLICDDFLITDLIACRKEGIVFSINSAEVYDKELSVNLQIKDFGGNNKNYENFTRSGTEEFNISLYISLDNENFVEYTANIPYEDGVEATDVLNKYLKNNLASFVELNKQEETNSIIYIKAKLDIITNSKTNDIISSTTATFLLYLSRPTMSHRAHWIGINTSDIQSEEVFKISEYKDQKFIKLIGNYQTLDENGNLTDPYPVEISINLKEGTITSTIDDVKGYEINMRTGQIVVGDISASEISNAKISGGTW